MKNMHFSLTAIMEIYVSRECTTWDLNAFYESEILYKTGQKAQKIYAPVLFLLFIIFFPQLSCSIFAACLFQTLYIFFEMSVRMIRSILMHYGPQRINLAV